MLKSDCGKGENPLFRLMARDDLAEVNRVAVLGGIKVFTILVKATGIDGGLEEHPAFM